jgi:hypothetical protein
LASWIVLDWDHEQFHVVCAQTSRRTLQITKALTWTHPEPFTPSTAERVGQALRDFLKSAKIAAAPVIVGLGRDRVFLKELRFPPIEKHEEASLVRFQTAKELTESIDNYSVDYVHLNGETGERQIMTVAGRRDMVAMIQTLCQAAGLKLHAVTPRVFGVSQALMRALPAANPLAPGRLNVVLSMGQRWAELCFFKGERLLQAQALANGPMLVSEVKRNLAVFQAQYAVNLELSGPDSLHVFGENSEIVKALQAGQSLPVRVLDPLEPEPELSADLAHPGYFAGGVGLVALWSQAVQKPVNLTAPKKQQAPTSETRQRGLFYGAAAALLAIFFIAGMWYVLASKRARLDELAKEKAAIEQILDDFKQERADTEAYRDWDSANISWLDELYDLTARHPHEVGFRVHTFNASTAGTLGAKKGAKDAFVGKVLLSGLSPGGKTSPEERLMKELTKDPHLRPTLNSIGLGERDYKMTIDIAKLDPKKYEPILKGPFQKMIAVEPPKVEAKEKIEVKMPEEKMPEEKMKEDPDAEGVEP